MGLSIPNTRPRKEAKFELGHLSESKIVTKENMSCNIVDPYDPDVYDAAVL